MPESEKAEVGYAVSAVFHDPVAPGTPVLAWPITRNGSPLVTRTRSEVWSLGDGTRVVAVDGHAGGIALTHVDVLPQSLPPAAYRPCAGCDEIGESCQSIGCPAVSSSNSPVSTQESDRG